MVIEQTGLQHTDTLCKPMVTHALILGLQEFSLLKDFIRKQVFETCCDAYTVSLTCILSDFLLNLLLGPNS